jgi:hypothetical protein
MIIGVITRPDQAIERRRDIRASAIVTTPIELAGHGQPPKARDPVKENRPDRKP